MRRAITAAAALVVAVLALSGCGGSGSGETSGSGAAGTSGAKTVTVTVKGDQVTPNGERVEVGTGQKVTLDITADRAGELHVHSSPEQEIPFDEGHTTAHVTIDRPGVVEIEEHESDVVVLQLEVS